MARFKQVYELARGWTAWEQPVRKGYRMGCCDCGLVHDLDFRLVKRPSGGHLIQFRAHRNNRSTAQLRRGMKRK